MPLILALFLMTQTPDKPRIFIEEFIQTSNSATTRCALGVCRTYDNGDSRNISLELTRALATKCATVVVTNEKTTADYVVKLAGGPVIFRQNGDLANIPTARKIPDLAKQICTFASKP
jgi:hypothetical protein